jgi:hypothetical protein
MVNYYLELLGLQAGASEEDIKKAYRRLSKKYHPDASGTERTRDQFIAITEAYNFLTEVGPRPHFESIAYDYDPLEKAYREQRERARRQARARAEEAFRYKQRALNNIIAVMNVIFLVGSFFNTMLIIDMLLPVQQKEAFIRDMYGGRYTSFEFDDLLVQTDEIYVPHVDRSVPAMIYYSYVFHQPIAVRLMLEGQMVKLPQFYSVYTYYDWLILVYFGVLIVYQRYMINSDNKMYVVMVVLFILFCQLVLFFSFFPPTAL